MKIKLLLFGLMSWLALTAVQAQTDVTITTSGGIFPTEKWVSITTQPDGAGTVVYAQGNGTYGNGAGLLAGVVVPIAPGTYYVNCYDSYDDGWDGTLIDISAFGFTIGNNGGVSPNDGTDTDTDFGSFGDPAIELEASFEIIVPANAPTCLVPNTVTASNITTTSVDLTWLSGGSGETEWEIEVVPTGTAPTGTATETGITATTHTVNSLPGSTVYDAYVRAVCSATDSSLYSAPVTFRIPGPGDDCANAVSLAVNNFGDCGTAAGSIFTLDFANATDLGTTDASCDAFGPNIGAWFEFTAPAVGSIILSSTGETIEYAIFDACGGTQLSCVSTPTNNSGILTGFTAGDVYKVMMWKDSNPGTTTDICIQAGPTCLEPTNLDATNITSTTADLDWTSGGSGETSWDIEVVPTGTAQTGTPNFPGITNPYTLPGLTPGVIYDYYVRANCGGGDFSTWAGPETFRTPGPLDNCATGDTLTVVADCASSTPYSFDLSSAGNLGSITGCDTSGNNPGGWFEFTTTAVTTITINTTTAMKMRILDSCGGTEVECFNSTSTSRIVSGLMANTNYKLAMWVDGTSSDVTDICIVEGPTCFVPTALTVDSVAQTEATLSWTAPTQGTTPVTYNVEVVAAGAVPTGTPTDAGVTSPFTKMGLTSGTAYDFYVSADCGAGDTSLYAGPESFTTAADCGDTVYDSGGPTGPYSASTLETYTFVPSSMSDFAQLEFQLIDLETCCDEILIYDGLDATAPLINGDVANVDVSAGDAPTIFTATNPDGALTLVLDPDSSVQRAGFEVLFNCVPRPACSVPTDLAVTVVDGTTAEYSWTAGQSMETMWDVAIVPQGATAPTVATIEDVTTNPYTDATLTAGTRYDFYLRADCGGSTSDFVGPVSFRTPGDGDTCDTSLDISVATTCDATTQTNIDFENAIDLGSNVASCASNGPNLGAWYQFRPNRNTSAIFLNASENVQYALFTTDAAGDCADVEIACGTLDATAATEIGQLNFRNFYKLVVWDDSGQLTSANICVENGPTCPTPIDLITTSANSTSAQLTWTPGDATQNLFNVTVFAQGADPLTATPVFSGTPTVNSITATGLTSFTDYDFYVQSDCGAGDLSGTAGPASFTTSPACGDTIFDTGGATGEYSNNEDYTITFVPDSNADNAQLEFQFVDLELRGTPTFWDNILIYDGLDTSAPILTTEVQLVDVANGDSPIIYTANNLMGALTLRFISDGSTVADGFEVLFNCVPRPTCPAVFDTSVTNITGTTADIEWDLIDTTQNLFEIEIVEAGDPQTGTNIFTSTTNSYNAVGLSPITSYDVYVRVDCGSGDFSDWVGPVTFDTPCVTIVPDYVENFSTYLPDCWSEAGDGDLANGPDPTTSTSNWLADGFANNGTTGSARIEIWQAGDVEWLITPEFDLSAGGYEVNFDVALTPWSGTGPDVIGSDDQVQFLISENGGAWTELVVWDENNVPSNTGDAINLPITSTSANVRFAFLSTEGPTSGGDVNFYVDNFQVRTTPSCFEVANLVLDSNDATTATISFDSGNATSNGNFEYVLVPAGDPAPTGAGVSISDATVTNGAYSFVIGNGTTTGSALMPNTAYDLYIREVCAAGDESSYNISPISFTTDCAVFVPDYVETFGTYVPDCWSEAGDGDVATGPDVTTTTSLWAADGFANNGTTGSARLTMSGNGDVEWLLSPSFDLSAGGYEINFDVALTPTFTTGSATMTEEYQMRLLVSETPGVWTILETWDVNNSPSNTGDAFNLPLASMGSNVQFAFLGTEGTITGTGVNFYVDNFQVRTIPTCLEVSGLTVVSTTTTTADITFNSSNAVSNGNFEYQVVPAGDPAPTGAGVAISDAAVTNGSYAFTIGDGITTGPALSPSTSYDLYVREVCGAGDESAYNFAGVSLETQCAAIDVYPHTTTFANNPPSSCWEEAGDGLPSAGPTGLGSSDWRQGRDYTNYNGAVTPSNAINLFSNFDEEWLISGEYDLTGADNDFLTIETAVTNWNNSAQPDTMGSDDEVQLLITTDGGANWVNLFTWTVQNQPAQNGTREYIDISAYSGIAQFAIWATDGANNDAEDYDFHVGELTIDATAGNTSVELTNEISLYPNPVSGDVLNIKMSNSSVESTNVTIHNSLGQQIMSREVSVTNRGVQLDGMSSLSKGMYFITVSNNGAKTTLKFIKE